jgi:hypothetical protein
MLIFGQNRACEGRKTADEGAFQRGTDDRSADASIGRCFCGGGDPEARDQRTDVYRWKAKYAGLEVDQVRQMAQLQEENLAMPPKPGSKLA